MRLVKYLTLAVLLAAVLIVSAESRLLYSVNFAFSPLQIYYDIELSENDLPVLLKIADQQDMTLCINDRSASNLQGMTIYSNADEASLLEQLHIRCGTYRSLFWDTPVQINLSPLEDAIVADEPIRVYVFGENRIAMERELKAHYTIVSGNVYRQDSAATTLAVGYFAWGLLILFAFFLSAFDAQSKKRSSFIRILYGASPLRLVIGQLLTELVCMVLLIFLVVWVTDCYSTVIADAQLFCCGILLLLACILPYVTLSGIRYQIITHERLTTARLLNFGYVYKTILLCLTIILFGLTASMGNDFFRNLKIMQYAKDYQDYSFVKIETSEVNLVNANTVEDYVQYQELSNLRIEEVYQQFYDSHDALIIEPILWDRDKLGVLYCNANAEDYIRRLFGEYQHEWNGKEAVLFLPESVVDTKDILEYTRRLLQQYEGEQYTPEIIIIRYTEPKTSFSFMPSEDSLLPIVTNPTVLYCSASPKETGALLTETSKVSIQGLAFRVDDAMLQELEAREDIRYEITPIGTALQRNMAESKRICGALVMICAVFIALNVFVCRFLIRMEYRLRAKEYCIKTVLGYTMLQKFGGFLFLSALSVCASGIVAALLQKQLAIHPIWILLICLGMLLTDTIAVMMDAVRTERSSIVQCLKGGAL